MIGVKSAASLVLCAAAILVAAQTGLLDPERLLAVDGRTVFAVACFAVIAGTLFFRFWRLDERSGYYLRVTGARGAWEDEAHFLGGERRRIAIGVNPGDAFDLDRRVLLVIYVGLFFLLGLATLDGRALDLLAETPAEISAAGSQFCPEDKTAPPDEADPEEPGCALLRRAYALGYAKDLGSCAGERKEQAREVCTRRQRDEPFLHYAWRRLESFYGGVRAHATRGYLEELRSDFERRFARIDTLYDAQRQLIAAAPRASHHLWTNLPEPEDAVIGTRECLDRTRLVPPRTPAGPEATRPSRVVEHVLTQLLFESRYEAAAGSCRELRIHWGAPDDACASLARDPEAFLTRDGAREQVAAVLGRRRASLAAAGDDPPRAAAPTVVLSFQCFIQEERAEPLRATHALTLEGTAFEARELRVAPTAADARALDIGRYQELATLLARGFRYGGLLSEAGLAAGSAGETLSRSLEGADFRLTRLYGLASLDVFLEPVWLERQGDLLEVYPYHQHLGNYVRLFRQHYRRERGRL